MIPRFYYRYSSVTVCVCQAVGPRVPWVCVQVHCIVMATADPSRAIVPRNNAVWCKNACRHYGIQLQFFPKWGYLWPYCTLCNKEYTEEHRDSPKHQDRVARSMSSIQGASSTSHLSSMGSACCMLQTSGVRQPANSSVATSLSEPTPANHHSSVAYATLGAPAPLPEPDLDDFKGVIYLTLSRKPWEFWGLEDTHIIQNPSHLQGPAKWLQTCVTAGTAIMSINGYCTPQEKHAELVNVEVCYLQLCLKLNLIDTEIATEVSPLISV